MAHGRHKTIKTMGDVGYSEKWSGVSYAPHCSYGCTCPDCGEKLHLEGDGNHYCPHHDDFKPHTKGCTNV